MTTYICNHCEKCDKVEITSEECQSLNYLDNLGQDYGFDFECLKSLCENTNYFDKSGIYSMMQEKGNLDALKYSLNNGHDIGLVIAELFMFGHTKFLQYVMENYTINKDVLKSLFNTLNTDENGFDEILFVHRYILNNPEKYQDGIMWDSEILAIVAGNYRTLNLLEYMIDNGCQMDENVCISAIKNKNFSNLELLRKVNCPGSEKYTSLI